MPIQHPKFTGSVLFGLAIILFSTTIFAVNIPDPDPPPTTSGDGGGFSAPPPECATFPEFGCYAHYIACSKIPDGIQVVYGGLSNSDGAKGSLVPFDHGNDGSPNELFYLAFDRDATGEARGNNFPFWMDNGDQDTAAINPDDLNCTSR